MVGDLCGRLLLVRWGTYIGARERDLRQAAMMAWGLSGPLDLTMATRSWNAISIAVGVRSVGTYRLMCLWIPGDGHFGFVEEEMLSVLFVFVVGGCCLSDGWVRKRICKMKVG